MPSSQRDNGGSGACGPIRPGRRPAPFLAARSWNGSAPLRRCGSSMASPNMPCMKPAKGLNCTWIADHVDAVLAQTLTTRAYRALNRVCLGQARRVRFKSRGRGLSSVENKRADTGLRFVLQPPEQGNTGYLLWQDDRLPALIDWEDPVVTYGLHHHIKYARLVVRQASSARAQGADRAGPPPLRATGAGGGPLPQAQTPDRERHRWPGPGTLHASPSCREEVPHALELLCAELAPDAQAVQRTAAPDGPTAACQQPGATTMSAGASRDAGRGVSPGSTASGIWPPGGAKPPESGDSPLTARACMAASFTRSWPWAPRSSPKRCPIARGRNSLARVWASEPQGCA